jgi:hypothetical protein
MTTIKVNGSIVTGATIDGFKSNAANAASDLSVWANACAIQTYSGNNNWANMLFALPNMQLATGELSAHGKKVLAYVKAHAPRFAYSKDKKVHMTGKDKADGKAFTDVNGAPLLDKAKQPATDFPLSFGEFLNFVRPPAPKTTALNAQTVINQVAKALAANVAGELEGNPALLGELATGLAALLAAVSAANAATDEKALADAKRIADGEARELLEIEAEKAAVVDAAKVAETLEVAAAAKPAKRVKPLKTA